MKQLLIVTLTISLTGCFFQSANNTDLRKAEYFCKGVENIDEIVIAFDGRERVQCMDNTSAKTDEIKLLLGETK